MQSLQHLTKDLASNPSPQIQPQIHPQIHPQHSKTVQGIFFKVAMMTIIMPMTTEMIIMIIMMRMMNQNIQGIRRIA